MRFHTALILTSVLLTAWQVPAAAEATEPTNGPPSLSLSGLEDMVYGVPATPAGAGVSNPESDPDPIGAPPAGNAGSGQNESDSQETSEENEGSRGADAVGGQAQSAEATNSPSIQTLLQIIIGIIFGQDRPWDETQGKRQ